METETKSTRPFNEGERRIVTSSRKFGIELETLVPSMVADMPKECLLGSASRYFERQSDGSISGPGYGVEWVSIPMARSNTAIRNACEALRSNGVSVNRSCGFHVHLDAEGFRNTEPGTKQGEEVAKLFHLIQIPGLDIRDTCDAVNSYGMRYMTSGFSAERKELNGEEYLILQGNSVTPRRIRALKLNHENAVYLRHLETEATTVPHSVNQGFKNLKTLMLLYHIADPLLRALQPQSRRQNNFCVSFSSLYSIDAIQKCESYEDIEALWYSEKDRRAVENRKNGGKYDSSRYAGINLHNLFRNDSTIEIRYHSATLNAEKILRWVQLHQAILDSVVSGKVRFSNNRRDLAGYAGQTNPYILLDMIAGMIGLSENSKRYFIERLNKFAEKTDPEADTAGEL